MRHMDDYEVVGPHTKVRELTEDMGHTTLLRDAQFLGPGKPPVKFLGWMLERTVNGFRLMRTLCKTLGWQTRQGSVLLLV